MKVLILNGSPHTEGNTALAIGQMESGEGEAAFGALNGASRWGEAGLTKSFGGTQRRGQGRSIGVFCCGTQGEGFIRQIHRKSQQAVEG